MLSKDDDDGNCNADGEIILEPVGDLPCKGQVGSLMVGHPAPRRAAAPPDGHAPWLPGQYHARPQ